MTNKTLKKLERIARKNIDPETQGRSRHHSFLLKRNKIIAYERNNINKTCTYHYNNGFLFPYCHSEVKLIKNIIGSDLNLARMTLVVLRIGGDHNGLINSKPCKSCQRIIKRCNFKNVIYSIKNDFDHL